VVHLKCSTELAFELAGGVMTARITDIQTQSFSAEVQQPGPDLLRLSLRGSADRVVFKKLEVLVGELTEHARAFRIKEIHFDVQELYFVDSSSLSLFLRLDNALAEGRSQQPCMLRFHSNPRLTWQKKSFGALSASSTGAITVD